MNNQIRYIEAALPKPYTILGLRLKPFCLGHYFLLRRFDCAFASDDKESKGGINDLILALCICCRSYEDFIEFLQNEDAMADWLGNWGEHIRKQASSGESMFDKFALFKSYIREGMYIPRYWEGESGGEHQSGSHWSQSVFLILTELGYTQSEALNLPLGKAFYDYFKYAERNGLLTLMSDAEIAVTEGAANGGS